MIYKNIAMTFLCFNLHDKDNIHVALSVICKGVGIQKIPELKVNSRIDGCMHDVQIQVKSKCRRLLMSTTLEYTKVNLASFPLQVKGS